MYFNSGEGRRLQRSDADIAERVLLWFADRQYPCLPLHDSFITYATLDDELPGVMEAMASKYLNLIIPTKRTYLAQYNGPTGLVTDDIGTLLTQSDRT